MKKLLVILLASVVAAAAFGEKGGSSIGATYIILSQEYTTNRGAVQNLTLSGVGLSNNFLSSAPFGLAGDITLAVILGGFLNNAVLDMSLYDMTIMLDIMAGIGYQLAIAPHLVLTLDLGPHVNTAIVSGGSTSINNAFVFGIGAATKLETMFSKAFGLYLEVKGAYDFMPIGNGQGTVFNSGFVLAGSGGMSLHI
jgi:hypothetical protein